MYIRRVTTRRTASGETYHSYRLVESRREGGRVRQVALLDLGRHFDLPEAVETQAQALAARFVARAPIQSGAAEFVEVDVASMELVQPRSVGVEHVGLHALAQLELDPLLASLGVNAVTRAITIETDCVKPRNPNRN